MRGEACADSKGGNRRGNMNMQSPMDRPALGHRLAEVEAKITGVQHQIGEQRQVIVKLESVGCPADHAKYLLAGLELLQAAYRDSRTAMLAELADLA